MTKRILLIGDLPCYGRMAVNAMLPVCTHFGFEVSVLPTALVSNNFAYGRFDVLDTTSFMEKTFSHWKALGFSFDAVYTGFLTSKAQCELVSSFCEENRARGIKIFTDPIMGDHGALYNGMSEENVRIMRALIQKSDFIMPNLTEACYLTDTPCRREGFSHEELRSICDKLRKLCPGSILITSALSSGRNLVYGYDAVLKRELALPYENIAKEFHGTGDVFAALFISKMLDSNVVTASALYAMSTVSRMIMRNLDNDDLFDGLDIGSSLDLL